MSLLCTFELIEEWWEMKMDHWCFSACLQQYGCAELEHKEFFEIRHSSLVFDTYLLNMRTFCQQSNQQYKYCIALDYKLFLQTLPDYP
jgi:hypothetical protein